ncbi:MAG: cyclic nucleotide-binding domain-containing protein [Desulfobacterales bacterium]|nr:cyclic nucleotide-binding domain-containing protein [Desulfobacterales bacterium]
MKKINVSCGITWVEIPEADFYLLCGCPADSVKHLMKKGLIVPTEKNGVPCETGPNAILLSDLSIQKGNFANLSEFPILQMLYRQGMILPGHPNNSGQKPMLIGLPDQVRAQEQYIYRGNYGLVSKEELQQAGVAAEVAEEMMRLKLRFAFGNIRDTNELVDVRPVGKGPMALKNGVTLERLGLNVYKITHGEDSLVVNMNLGAEETYEAPFMLGAYHIRKQYFSVVHIGEGDGWDINRGCMSSVITFQGRLFLIDAPPNIQHILTALGFSINEVEGIFHTHAHDDHFSGLTTLIRSGRRIKYFATPLVRASVVKKLSALMSLDEERFADFFHIIDLHEDQWNNIDGLEVKPVFSPHPVETTIMFFRTFWEDRYRTYAHMADIISFGLLEKMTTDPPENTRISTALYDKTRAVYLTPADIKKLDNGGGMIHGVAEDFTNDTSAKILLSHSALPLSAAHRDIGSNAVFGTEDILIQTEQDYNRRSAYEFLTSYFPEVPKHQIMMLVNAPIETYNSGSILIRREEKNKDVFLILSGVLEYIDINTDTILTQSVGSLVGEYFCVMEQPSKGTFRSASYVDALRIPGETFKRFAHTNRLDQKIKTIYANHQFLQNTWLFGHMISYPMLTLVADAMTQETCDAGKTFRFGSTPELIVLQSGELRIPLGKTSIDLTTPGDFVGEGSIIAPTGDTYEALAVRPSVFKRIPGDVLKNIPIIQWKLISMHDARTRFIPEAPTELAADSSDTGVILKWQDNSNNETGFKIMRKTGEDNAYQTLAVVSSDITCYVDTTARSGSSYGYLVKSVNAAGESQGSNAVEIGV